MGLAHTEPLRFGKDKQDMMDLFLAQAAIAIQNARLYREAKRRRDVAEVLARLARELTLDPGSGADRQAARARRGRGW